MGWKRPGRVRGGCGRAISGHACVPSNLTIAAEVANHMYYY